MFRSFTPDFKQTRSSRITQKQGDAPSSPIAERPYTAFANFSGAEDFKPRLPSNTLEGMKVLWRQSQMAQNLRGPNRDGQMPVEKLSDSSDSSDNSSQNFFANKLRVCRSKRGGKKDVVITEVKEEVKVSEPTLTSQETKKVVDKKKEVAEVAVQAMRPASIDPLIEGRLKMLESRLRLEEMRSKAWCVRMTEAEDNVKQLQAQVKALSAGATGANAPNRFAQSPLRERGLWPSNSTEGRKPYKLGVKTSQVFGKDFTAEFNAILQKIRKDNESEEMVGDFCTDAKI